METPKEMFSSAPDVTPGDVWDDAACLFPDGPEPAVSLPPKRVKQDKPGRFATAADGDGGLRIGIRTFSHFPAETFPKLEMQEIHGDVLRLHPEKPETERMPRHVVFHEKPASPDGLAMTGESREWGSPKRQPILWILGTGMAVAAVVAGAVLALPLVNKSNAARPGQGGPALVVEPIASAESLGNMLARKPEAERVFREFVDASSAEDALRLLRDPEEVADLIRAHHSPSVAATHATLKTRSWGVREIQSLTYAILTGSLQDYTPFEAYFTLTGGRLVMDWKASTAYGTADFTQLAANKGNAAEIRGFMEPADYYTAAFPEESFQAYQLVSPDQCQIIWAYCRRGGDVQQSLKMMFKDGYILQGRKEPKKVTVRLTPGPADSMPGQWEIVELLHKEWIAP